MPPHEAMQPAPAPPVVDPDGLLADEATIAFAERLRFAVVLQQLASGADEADLAMLDLSNADDRAAWAGTLAVARHARTLRLTGWTDADGVWRRE